MSARRGVVVFFSSAAASVGSMILLSGVLSLSGTNYFDRLVLFFIGDNSGVQKLQWIVNRLCACEDKLCRNDSFDQFRKTLSIVEKSTLTGKQLAQLRTVKASAQACLDKSGQSHRDDVHAVPGIKVPSDRWFKMEINGSTSREPSTGLLPKRVSFQDLPSYTGHYGTLVLKNGRIRTGKIVRIREEEVELRIQKHEGSVEYFIDFKKIQRVYVYPLRKDSDK